MKLSVLANLYGTKTLDETLKILSDLDVHTVEIGAGGYPGKAHCNPAELLADDAKYNEFIATFKKYDTTVCALAVHGNAVHPNPDRAATFDNDFHDAVLLAEKMGVDTIIEAGPGKTIAGFVRKTVPSIKVIGVSAPEDIDKLLETLG